MDDTPNPNESPRPEESPAPQAPPESEPPQKKKRSPRVAQTWVNLRVWVPFLLNPFERKRVVHFDSKNFREGLDWQIELAEQCWQCGQNHDIKRKRKTVKVRAFEYPLQVFAGTALAVLVILILGRFLFSDWLTVLFALAIIGLGVGVLYVKSWEERVLLAVWACADHAQFEELPEMAVYDDELICFLPSTELAKLASAEIKRRARGRRHEDIPDDPFRA